MADLSFIVGSHNQFLDGTAAAVRATPAPWQGYANAGLISAAEADVVKAYVAPAPPSPAVASALLGILGKVARTDTQQYILVTLDDILSSNVTAANLFADLGSSDASLPYGPLLKALGSADEFTQVEAAKVASAIISYSSTVPAVDLAPLYDWLAFNVKSPNPQIQDLAVQFAGLVLAPVPIRATVYKHATLVPALLDVLRTGSPNAQMQYQICYCFWLLSFVPEVAADMQPRLGLIPIFTDVAKAALKEKVVRVVLATFKNMVVRAPSATILPMIGAKVLPFLDNLSARKWTDPEIVEDIDFLKSELAKNVANLTTWDEYEAEVKSGKLDWSPTHQSDAFWKINGSKLSEKDSEIVRILAKLLATSTDPQTLAVAANDIGQYVKYYPQGKKLVQEIGAKTRIMELMTSDNPDVRYQALLAVQKFMVNAWA
ncbi:ATPase, V1 complex, subunit H [Hyaloraphidium curvatum]|nr:ATPase, V1 complex, subunit H [Hyaloraphidium curvatum]